MDFPSHHSNPIVFGKRIAITGKLGGMTIKGAKQLIREHGGIVVDANDRDIDVLVQGADQSPAKSQERDRFSDASSRADRDSITVMDESQFWQAIGLIDSDIELSRLYTPRMLADLLGVSIATIRRWHRRGLIRPVRQIQKLPYFDFQEIASARRIARLIQNGQTPNAIEKQLADLATSEGVDRPLSQLSIIVEGKNVLLRDGEGLVETSGQKHFDFETATETDALAELEYQSNRDTIKIFQTGSGISDVSPDQDGEHDLDRFFLSFEDACQPDRRRLCQTPADFFDLAAELEDDGEYESAVEIYRALAIAHGPTADVSFRIAELLYLSGDLTGARERYYTAIELDSSLVEARANLGCVLVELGQTELAAAAFYGALEHHTNFADVHFHLARLLDDTGKPDQADRHWEAFLQLAPKSPWAEEARQRMITIGDDDSF